MVSHHRSNLPFLVAVGSPQARLLGAVFLRPTVVSHRSSCIGAACWNRQMTWGLMDSTKLVREARCRVDTWAVVEWYPCNGLGWFVSNNSIQLKQYLEIVSIKLTDVVLYNVVIVHESTRALHPIVIIVIVQCLAHKILSRSVYNSSWGLASLPDNVNDGALQRSPEIHRRIWGWSWLDPAWIQILELHS